MSNIYRIDRDENTNFFYIYIYFERKKDNVTICSRFIKALPSDDIIKLFRVNLNDTYLPHGHEMVTSQKKKSKNVNEVYPYHQVARDVRTLPFELPGVSKKKKREIKKQRHSTLRMQQMNQSILCRDSVFVVDRPEPRCLARELN